MLPIIHVGPLSIPTPGIISILGLWIGLSLAEKYSYKSGIQANMLYNLVFTTLISGIIAACLVYILRFSSTFLADPISMISPNPNMFDVQGGIAGGLLAVTIYTNRKKLVLSQVLDALTPLFATMMISASIANLASGNAFGSPTQLPWAIDLWGTKRHPTQIYEMLGASLCLFILWPTRSWLTLLKPGGLFWAFLAFSSFNRLFFEAFRGDSSLILEKYRGVQFLALIMMLISLWIVRKKLPDLSSFDPHHSE